MATGGRRNGLHHSVILTLRGLDRETAREPVNTTAVPDALRPFAQSFFTIIGVPCSNGAWEHRFTAASTVFVSGEALACP
jgi:hypothetical protein